MRKWLTMACAAGALVGLFFGLTGAVITPSVNLRNLYYCATGSSSCRSQNSKNADTISVCDFESPCPSGGDDTAAVQAAIAARGANGLLVAPGTFLRTDTYGDAAMFYLKRTDALAPLSGAGILNPYLYPMLRLDYFAQSNAVTGAGAGLLFYAPGIKGKTITTFTAPVTGSGSPQSVAVADSSVFVIGEVANVDLNQGGTKSENVTITAIGDSTHVTGVFTKSHSSGTRLFVSGKGDKIGIGCAMADAAGNTNYVFCENLNVQAVSTSTNGVTAAEWDVANNTGAPPGAFAGDSAPYVGGLSLMNSGANDATAAIGIGTTNGSTRFLNGIAIEAAKNYGVAITSAAGAPTTGVGIQAATTNGIAIGSNQAAASNPNYTLSDPTNGILLTSRGTSGSVASNTIRWQELVASVSHTWDSQVSSGQHRFGIYDGTWNGAAFDNDGGISTQGCLRIRNASNTQIASWCNQSGQDVLTAHTYVSAFSNPAASGGIRLPSGDQICFRNAANSGDICITKNASDQFVFPQIVKRTAGCATAASAGAVCSTTVTWGTAFADTNYTVVCMGDLVTSGVPVNGGITAKIAASVTFQTVAMTAAAAQYTTIDCHATP